ncbi:hypothetical protein HQ40_03950 [Porphyromonas gulae]|nr:hypothetical protein HQ40_03950 [Porphyromonas gulae]
MRAAVRRQAYDAASARNKKTRFFLFQKVKVLTIDNIKLSENRPPTENRGHPKNANPEAG